MNKKLMESLICSPIMVLREMEVGAMKDMPAAQLLLKAASDTHGMERLRRLRKIAARRAHIGARSTHGRVKDDNMATAHDIMQHRQSSFASMQKKMKRARSIDSAAAATTAVEPPKGVKMTRGERSSSFQDIPLTQKQRISVEEHPVRRGKIPAVVAAHEGAYPGGGHGRGTTEAELLHGKEHGAYLTGALVKQMAHTAGRIAGDNKVGNYLHSLGARVHAKLNRVSKAARIEEETRASNTGLAAMKAAGVNPTRHDTRYLKKAHRTYTRSQSGKDYRPGGKYDFNAQAVEEKPATYANVKDAIKARLGKGHTPKLPSDSAAADRPSRDDFSWMRRD